MKYKHLSQAERCQIYALMKAGQDRTQIAKVLNRNKSTISRDFIRNTGVTLQPLRLGGNRPLEAKV